MRGWPFTAQIAAVSACVVVFVCAGHLAANALIASERTSRLRELGDPALRRAEAVVARPAGTRDALIGRGPAACDPAALQAIRLQVYQRGAVKDIRIVSRDGAVQCSAYSETLEFDKEWAGRDDMAVAPDGATRLFRVEQFSGTALGVLKDMDAASSIVAVIGVDGSQFDILPRELRAEGAIALELGEGRLIASSGPVPAEAQATPDHVAVTSRSDRYPMLTRVIVSPAALAVWGQEPYGVIVAAAAVLGVLFGALFGRVVARSPDPVAALDAAIAAREFQPWLQPIFDLSTPAIVGCEALARWVHADGTVVPPARFIPLAESSGRIRAITWQILEASLVALRPVLLGDSRFKLSVNVVPDHLVSADFPSELHAVVARTGASPRQIVLEITERDRFEDLTRAAAVIAELRRRGFRVALDDVGVGHGGLSYIQSLGADIIKIDKVFVDSVGREAAATAIVQLLARLARELDMRVVAEGIESAAQAASLAACRVHEGQGYLVSPPLPAPKFLDLLASGARADARAA